jgi:ArsR family transcriptional regulator, arsenate/arsenite/antimonite-responsive transcriptional repressor
MDAKQFEKISKALADPNRLMILKEIKKKQNCLYCMDIYSKVNLAQPSISHHLKQLTDANLISSEKEGRTVKYSLNNGVFEEFITFLRSFQV